jgi:hypothetical protein
MVLRCYTDRHSTVIAAKSSTLDDKQGFYFSEHGEVWASRPSSAEAFLGAVESERIARCDGEETLSDRRRQTHVVRETREL